jgi:type II secretion system protein N
MSMKRTLFFLIYFLAALAVFSVLRFPHQEAAVKISRMGETMFPGLDITLDRVSPALPTGLKTENPRIRIYDVITVVPEELRIIVPVPEALRLKKDLRVISSLWNGTVVADITEITLSPPACSGLEVTLTGLQIRDLDTAMQGLRASLSFDLSGRYQVQDRLENPAGTGNLILSRVTCAIQDDFLNTMGIRDLDFDQVSMTFERHGSNIDILQLHATGSIMNIQAAGQITLTGARIMEPSNWQVDLKGSVYPQPAHVSRFATVLPMDVLFKNHPEKGIPFTLTGPADALEMNR